MNRRCVAFGFRFCFLSCLALFFTRPLLLVVAACVGVRVFQAFLLYRTRVVVGSIRRQRCSSLEDTPCTDFRPQPHTLESRTYYRQCFSYYCRIRIRCYFTTTPDQASRRHLPHQLARDLSRRAPPSPASRTPPQPYVSVATPANPAATAAVSISGREEKLLPLGDLGQKSRCATKYGVRKAGTYSS